MISSKKDLSSNADMLKDLKIKPFVRLGAVGLLLGTIKAYEAALKKDLDYLIVFEDDFIIETNFYNNLLDVLDYKADFDIISLSPYTNHLQDYKVPDGLSQKMLFGKYDGLPIIAKAFSYIISKPGMKKFIDYVYSNECDPVDVLLFNTIELDWYYLNPQIKYLGNCINTNEDGSAIIDLSNISNTECIGDTLSNKIILQTSINKPTKAHIDGLMKMAPGWQYLHFNDAEILEFFKNNPIPGFEDVEKKFRSIRRGEHRADLFRYYYIYLNGGFFVDFDFKLLYDINNVVKDYDFVISTIDNTHPAIFNSNKRSRAFNGYMYAKQNHPIILQALRHIYNIDLNDLGPIDGSWDVRYHIICEHLYNLVSAYPDKESVKIYSHTDSHLGSFVLDGDNKLGEHARSEKENMEYEDPLTIPEYVKYNKNDYVLFFCSTTIRFGKNSGIQRYVRNFAKGLLASDVKLVPVVLDKNTNTFTIPETKDLDILANYNGPKVNDWGKDIFKLSIDEILNKSTHIIIPELPDNLGSEELNNLINLSRSNNLFVISVFHDAVAYILKDHYSQHQQKNFLKYMKDVSRSDVIVSVSESSHNDFVKIIKSPRNIKLQTMPILLPSDIDVKNLPQAKVNNSKNINVLCVSAFEKRKNHIGLLRAFGHAKKLAAKNGYDLSLTMIASYQDPDKVHMAKIKKLASLCSAEIMINVSEDVLLEKYSEADFTIYPSVYEGYGIPIVESLRFNKPVLFSNTSSMKELAVLGGSVTFDPSNLRELSEKIVDLSINAEKRYELLKEIKNIKHVSWQDYAQEFIKNI